MRTLSSHPLCRSLPEPATSLRQREDSLLPTSRIWQAEHVPVQFFSERTRRAVLDCSVVIRISSRDLCVFQQFELLSKCGFVLETGAVAAVKFRLFASKKSIAVGELRMKLRMGIEQRRFEDAFMSSEFGTPMAARASPRFLLI